MVIGRDDPGADEHIVLDLGETSQVDRRLDPDSIPDRDIVVDNAAPADNGTSADSGSLTNVGLISQDRPIAHQGAAENHSPGADRHIPSQRQPLDLSRRG